MSWLRRLFELRGDRQLPANFTVLTLGQVVPVIALRKDARWYHADLKALDDKPFRLVDFSAPPDGAAYHGVHPIRLVSDRCAARVDMLSPRFNLFYDPENYPRSEERRVGHECVSTGSSRWSPVNQTNNNINITHNITISNHKQ